MTPDNSRELKDRLEQERLFGLDSIPFSPTIPATSAPPTGPTEVAGASTESLDAIQTEVKACTLCPLHETRTNTVFGVGNPNSPVLFIGEAPGADEDMQGEPFVGRAGKLLTKIIETTLARKREDVYIANILKCRPPGNRNPAEPEMRQCMPYLFRQIEAMRPRIVCALGRIAAQALLETTTPIGKLRGRFHPMPGFDNIVLLPTYHPAYLLRNPPDKRKVWEDMKTLKARLDGLES